MKTSKRPLALVFSLVLTVLACPAVPVWAEDPAPAVTVKDLNEQTVMALAWLQNSAEYRELCYQSFNLASLVVDKAVAGKKPGDKPLAVISDLDETLLDNTAYDAGFLGKNEAYAGKTWDKWELAAQALAVPGAVEFAQYAQAQGVEVFYVTNRDQAGFDATLKNLAALGFPFADAQHLKVAAGTSNKQPRFDEVAQKFTVAAWLGDNANDMPIGTYGKAQKDRNALVDQNKAQYGTRFIVLPNPIYGDWEPALAQGYWGLTPAGKDAARKAQLRTWSAPQ